jgi:hypothetical protein
MAAAMVTTSTTLEGQFLEVARELLDAELALPVADRPGNITITPSFGRTTVNITGTLPITVSGVGNQYAFSANTYLT